MVLPIFSYFLNWLSWFLSFLFVPVDSNTFRKKEKKSFSRLPWKHCFFLLIILNNCLVIFWMSLNNVVWKLLIEKSGTNHFLSSLRPPLGDFAVTGDTFFLPFNCIPNSLPLVEIASLAYSDTQSCMQNLKLLTWNGRNELGMGPLESRFHATCCFGVLDKPLSALRGWG